ncbi:PHP domain-containing protein [Anoxynatronum sibiricum]
MRIDMHTHTHASDGTFSASQLIHYAREKGLGGIAITDHDTMEALPEARSSVTEDDSFWLLPGIEFSTETEGTEIHLLGYGLDETDSGLQDLMLQLKEARNNRSFKMVKKLNQLGINITMDQVHFIAGDGIVGRVHVARAMLEQRVVSSIQEAFDGYLRQGKPAYVSRYKLVPKETIDMIHQLGGISVLAHPGLIRNDQTVEEIIEAGINGIEVYYPTHRLDQKMHYLQLAKNYKLLATGGSDFHAPPQSRIRETDLGDCAVELEPIRYYFNNRSHNS